jgi:hypothetical protein
MFVIFGFGRRRTRDHGPVVACTCPHCHNVVSLSLLHVTTWFTLFFIPVIPYSSKRFLVCSICRFARPVTKGNGPALEEMASITQSWRGGTLSDDDYAQRIDAFWAHMQPADAAA